MKKYDSDPMVQRALELLGDAPGGAHLIPQIRQEFGVSKDRATTIVAHAMRVRRQREEKGTAIQSHPNQGQPDESPFDFDSGGFGIGGLARYEEKPFIPSERALKRYEKALQQATTCRVCGSSDGAMFTTIAGGDVCDDCVG